MDMGSLTNTKRCEEGYEYEFLHGRWSWLLKSECTHGYEFPTPPICTIPGEIGKDMDVSSWWT